MLRVAELGGVEYKNFNNTPGDSCQCTGDAERTITVTHFTYECDVAEHHAYEFSCTNLQILVGAQQTLHRLGKKPLGVLLRIKRPVWCLSRRARPRRPQGRVPRCRG